MKKGCFLSAVILLTIIIGVGLYLYKTNKNIIKDFGKENVLAMISSQIERRFDKLKSNEYKDSLRVLIKREMNLRNKKRFAEAVDQIGDFAKQIKDYARDLKLDSLEFAQLKLMVIQHEGSTKN